MKAPPNYAISSGITEYKPLYRWQETWPQDRDRDGNRLRDYVGRDGDITVGRIRFEDAGPMKGKWQWNGGGPIYGLRVGRLLPQQGYCETAREASRMVEEYYHRLMRHNGKRGSKDPSES